MWMSVSSPCLSVFTPYYAGYEGGTPVEWQTGSNTFSRDSAWWAFENIQRIVAPYSNPDPVFYAATAPVIRDTWDKVEETEFKHTATLEDAAMKLWRQGKQDQACKLVTDYTNTRLHTNYNRAIDFLDWLAEMGGVPGPR